MATTNTMVIKVTCGATLKTVISGQPVEIECEGEDGTRWQPPRAPSGGGGVLAYIRPETAGPRLDLTALAERYHAGHLIADDLPLTAPGEDWAVYLEPEGDLKSLGPITFEG
jgi:hypothetical protein